MAPPQHQPTPSLFAPVGRFITTRRATALALATLIVSCGENVTAPVVSLAPRHAPLAARDVVIMERTTYKAGHGGALPVVHSSRNALTPQVRLVSDATPTQGNKPQAAITEFPRPPIALPARSETAMCSDLPAWSETSSGAGGTTIHTSGSGDAPASTIRIVEPNGSETTIERTWARTANSWELARQVTTTDEGRYRDVVNYRHETSTGQKLDHAIPRVHCARPQTSLAVNPVVASRAFYAPHAVGASASFFPSSGIDDLQSCSGAADDCYYKQLTVYRDEVAVTVAGIALAAACITPAVVTVAPCVIATTAYYAALAYLALDALALKHCLHDTTNAALVGIGAPTSVGQSLTHRTNSSLFTSAPAGGKLASCGATTGGPMSADCHFEDWEISYDGGMTWEYFDTILVCDSQI